MSAPSVGDHFAQRYHASSQFHSGSTNAPVFNVEASSDEQNDPSRSNVNDNAGRRIRPGTKATDMAFGPPLVPLSQLDSPFQLQEHLKALYQHYTNPADSATFTPINRKLAMRLATPPEGVDRFLWLYELCRFLIMKVNHLVVAFFAGEPPCSQSTCSDMRAAEWQYLCAVHEPPKTCCAIDYCCHTLDWATDMLASSKRFPSRLALSDSSDGLDASVQLISNIFRRVYRVFAHAWSQHRQIFWEVESHHGLYVFFKTVCDYYSLAPEEDYCIPPEASGQYSVGSTRARKPPGQRMTILRKVSRKANEDHPSTPSADRELALPINHAASVRRHKHSPSRGTAVGPIEEATEDDDANKNVEAKISTAVEPINSSDDTRSSTPIATVPLQSDTNKGSTTATQPNTNSPQIPEGPTIDDTEGKHQESESARLDPPSFETSEEKSNEPKAQDLPVSKDELSQETAQATETTNANSELIDILPESDAVDHEKSSQEAPQAAEATRVDNNLTDVSPDAEHSEKATEEETQTAETSANDNNNLKNVSPRGTDSNDQEGPSNDTEVSSEPPSKSPMSDDVVSEDIATKAEEAGGEAVEITLDIPSPEKVSFDKDETEKEETASLNPITQENPSTSIGETQVKQQEGHTPLNPPVITTTDITDAKASEEQENQTSSSSDSEVQPVASKPGDDVEPKAEDKKGLASSPSPSLPAKEQSQEPPSLALSEAEAPAESEGKDHKTTDVKTGN